MRFYLKNPLTQSVLFRNPVSRVRDSFSSSAYALGLFLASAKKSGDLRLPPVRSVFYRQIYFTGIEALGKLAAIGALIGIVVTIGITRVAGADASLAAKALVWTGIKEIGPLFAAFIVIARSCAAVAAELGSMRVNGEVDSLLVMGIDPVGYLITPRLAGITLSVFILVFYFQVFSVAGGLALASLFAGVPFYQYLIKAYEMIGLGDIGISLLKGLAFGAIISTVSCYRGFRVKGSAAEVPKATTAAVMQSIFLVLMADAAIAIMLK